MPTTVIDGIRTHYEVTGNGPPLLMFSPGGFNASLDTWRTQGIYRRLDLLPQLTQKYTCITFDKRETGESDGRVEHISWTSYAKQGKGLLNHLNIKRAHLMGGCVGCSIATTLAVAHPEQVLSMVLYSPAGGPRYRMTQQARLGQHLAYVTEHGLAAVVDLAHNNDNDNDATFTQDPRLGPWVTVIRRDPTFAKNYAQQDTTHYATVVTAISRQLFDRDTVPGPEPEDLMLLNIPTLIVPGEDTSHAPSAARYLQECLPQANFWDAPVTEQTKETAPKRILEFLDAV